MINAILIITILLLAKKLFRFLLLILTLPFFPFVIAYNLKRTKPAIAYSLVTLWGIFYLGIFTLSFLQMV